MEQNVIKAAVCGFFTALTSWLGVLAIPIYVMVGCNIIDYITGLMAARSRGERISSAVGLRGIARKICQWLLVMVGWMLDRLLSYMAETVSPNFKVPVIIAIFVAFWLVANEMLSILENIDSIGVPIPGFLKKAIVYFLHAAEKEAVGAIPEDTEMLNFNVEDAENAYIEEVDEHENG